MICIMICIICINASSAKILSFCCSQSPPLWLNMKEMYVEKSENGQSEELERDENDEQGSLRFTLRLCNEKQPTSNSVYLSFDNKQNLVS